MAFDFDFANRYIDTCNTYMRKRQFTNFAKTVKIKTEKEAEVIILKETEISRAALGRIPIYLKYLESLPEETENISATSIAKALGLGEVQVRKDLGALCGSGKPKIGYSTAELIVCLKNFIGGRNGETVIVGAGKLGRALLDYGGFGQFGLSLLAAFDAKTAAEERSDSGKPILPMSFFSEFCTENNVKIGIIAVPAEAAQSVCDLFIENGIKAIWCFAPCRLAAPADVMIQYENMALSLAHLKSQITN